MSKKLFVGNLPFSATEEGVREMFIEYGKINDFAWITDRETGRFRGFCFVEMDPADADKAIAALDGQDVDGRSMRVNEAQPREGGNKPRGGGYRGGNRGGSGGNRGGNSGDGSQNRNRW